MAMRWIISIAIFFAAPITLAETQFQLQPQTVIVLPNNNNNQDSGPCATSASSYALDACKRAQQAQINREKQNQQQSAAPSTIPLWQQALQHPTPADNPPSSE